MSQLRGREGEGEGGRERKGGREGGREGSRERKGEREGGREGGGRSASHITSNLPSSSLPPPSVHGDVLHNEAAGYI